ncbi:MAG: LamG domain-containing protein [Thermodesulfobacteriota bacterium]
MRRVSNLPLILLSLLASFLPCRSYCACTPPPADLVSWWQGEGNADDALGTYNGTPENGTAYAAGYVGQAFSFDGVDDYVVIANGIVPSTARFFTLDAWIYPESFPGVDETRMILYGGSTGGEYELLVAGNTFRFGVKLTDGQWYTVNSPAALQTWTHLAAVRRGTEIELWVNGTLKTDAAVPDLDLYDAADGWNNSRIGAYNEYTDQHKSFWHGLVDELDIFSRALEGAEISAIYNAGGSGKCTEDSPAFPWTMFNAVLTGTGEK